MAESYEELRKKRLEENKKRMEELNLKSLSKALNNNPKSSPAKPRTPRKRVELTATRRSTRVADKPKPNYKDQVAFEPMERVRRSHSQGHSRRDLFNRVYASPKERQYAIERAEHLESTLESEYPSFVKPMLQSHTTGGFWLGLPNKFCKKNLPLHDVMITLVDEEGEEFETKYLAEKTGLSGGWRGFSIDHNLVDGDCVVFQLVAPTQFKVYIIRVYDSEDNEGGEDENQQEEEDNEGGEDEKQQEEEDNEGGEDEKQQEEEAKEEGKELDVQNRRSKRIRARK